jgi:hypothetical protein
MLGTMGLSALIGAIAVSGTNPGPAPVELRLVLIDLVGIAPQVSEGMLGEASRLLSPNGVVLQARTSSAAEQRQQPELAVILLPARSRGPSRNGLRLGAVKTTAGVTTIWIDVTAVAGVADANRGLHCCNAEMRRLGLALGRVLTHELVHVLHPGLRHTRGGLMAARVGRATLVEDLAPLAAPEIAKRPDTGVDN